MILKLKDRNGEQLQVGDKIKIFSRRDKTKFGVREIVNEGGKIGIISHNEEFSPMYFYPSSIIEKLK